MSYSLAAKFATEALSSLFAMYVGLGVVANDHLSRTKGGKHGFGFIALGFGMAFGIPIMMFGFVSAHLNPAMCTALLINGEMGWAEYFVASAGEYLGMFVGALLMWAHYWPHFNLPVGDSESPASAADAEADSKKKLSCFVTRPAAKVHWTHTVFVEFMCTVTLLVAALLVYSRHDQIDDPQHLVSYRATEGLSIGFMVFVLVLGLGGVTSIAANPARDLSPRLAHWIAGIENKGSSEWAYAIIPFAATNAGGIVAGYLGMALFSLTGFTV